MSRDISCTDVPRYRSRFGLGLVVPGGVGGEFADELPGFGEDPDVAVVGEDQDSVAGESAAQADVVESAVVAQGDRAAVAHAVLADPVVPIDDGDTGGKGFGTGGERLDRGARRARWGRMVL